MALQGTTTNARIRKLHSFSKRFERAATIATASESGASAVGAALIEASAAGAALLTGAVGIPASGDAGAPPC